MKQDFYKQKKSILLIIFYLFALFLTYINLSDFGIHIEEKFHRLNGHYWLNYIAGVFGQTDLERVTELKISKIGDYTLSPVSYYNKFGVVLDLPLAFIEIFLNLKEITDIYYLKHYISFIIFLIGSFFFYQILNKRFNNFYLSFLGVFLYVTSPRIFGDSFLYKDVLFLSFFTICVFFLLECVTRLNLKNLIYFSFFNALAINLRVFATLLPFLFIFILIIKNFHSNIFYKKYKILIIYLFFLFLFTYIFWPYLWESPFKNFIELFTSLKKDIQQVKIFYFNEYIPNTFLPSSYVINWIFISSPIFQSIFFLIGFSFYLRRFLKRFFKLRDKVIYNDLWRSKQEEKDFVLFFLLISFYFILIFGNATFYNGWRLVYFFNLFILYFGILSIDIILKILRKKNILKNFFNIIILVTIFYNCFSLIYYHPFQSIYFNSFLTKKMKNSFEGDYYGLSAKNFFYEINKIDKRNEIKIAVASHTPLQRGLESLPINLRKRFNIVGQEYRSADYIYKNNISEVNSKLNKKYEVPKNFSKIYELEIGKVVIYEIYKLDD